ncbi:MAG: type II toxin-antitoxin system VapC family toxin [Candidatus Coatesbacteria bacterium]
MRVCFDPSAFAKRYVAEAGSGAVIDRCAAADEICLSALAVPELVSMLTRLRRAGELTEGTYHDLRGKLEEDLGHAAIVEVSASIIASAVGFIERAPLQASDSIHLACARAADCDLFVTSDRQQHAAARSLGFKAELVG